MGVSAWGFLGRVYVDLHQQRIPSSYQNYQNDTADNQIEKSLSLCEGFDGHGGAMFSLNTGIIWILEGVGAGMAMVLQDIGW